MRKILAATLAAGILAAIVPSGAVAKDCVRVELGGAKVRVQGC